MPPFHVYTGAVAAVQRERTPKHRGSGICLSLGPPFISYVPLDRKQISQGLCSVICKNLHLYSLEHSLLFSEH